MIRIASESELRSTFRSLDRDEVQVPSALQFPLVVKDYLKWVEPSGHRLFLVFEDEGSLRGIVFQRTHGAMDTAAAMCQWCHAVRSGPAVGLLTAAAARDRRVGVHLCTDLNCRENALSLPGIHDFQEAVSGRERLENVLRRMREFARKNLY